MADDIIIPPERTSKDDKNDFAKSVVGSIPVAGRAAEAFYDQVVRSPIEKKVEAWRQAVYEKLVSLEEQDFLTVDELEANEEVASVVSAIILATMKTLDQEKLDLLKNAAVNAILSLSVEEGYKDITLSHIESLSAWHVRMLRTLADPTTSGVINPSRGVGVTITEAVPIKDILIAAHPELEQDFAFMQKLYTDLVNDALIMNESIDKPVYIPNSMPSPNGRDYSTFTTKWGDLVLQYFSDPELRFTS